MVVSIFVFVAFAFCCQISVADENNQVKVLEYTTDYANSSYVNADPAELKVIKVNETYNRLYIKAEIVNEFPLDTIFIFALYRGESTDGSWTFVDLYHTFICDKNDKNRKYLPHNLLSMSRTDGQKCVQKGDYEFEDAGIFKFNELMSDGQGYYYKSLNVLYSGEATISIARVLYQWGTV